MSFYSFKKSIVLVGLVGLVFTFPFQEAKAAVSTTTVTFSPITCVSHGNSSISQLFVVPADFTSVEISPHSSALSPRGTISINGTSIIFDCDHHDLCGVYPDEGDFLVLNGNACVLANKVSSIDVTSLVTAGNNTIAFAGYNCDNDGLDTGLLTMRIQITTPDSCANLSCEAANAALPCACGTATADVANPWCCAGNNAIYNAKALCQVGACTCVSTCATGPNCRAVALADANVTGAVWLRSG